MKRLRSTNWLLQNSYGDGKDSIGNIVAKKYICMTHAQWCGDCLRELGGGLGEGGQRGKNGTIVIA